MEAKRADIADALAKGLVRNQAQIVAAAIASAAMAKVRKVGKIRQRRRSVTRHG